MISQVLLSLLVTTHLSFSLPSKRASNSSLELENPPDSPQPYVIRHYSPANAVIIGNQVYRFPVTGPSSGGEFSILGTNAPQSNALGVLPHIHQQHYENFFAYKGRFQLWAQHDGEQQSRLLTQGDYGAVPPGTNHTFQTLDPDTEMLGVIAPGGFEDLFYFLGTKFNSTTYTPYDPSASESTNSGGSASIISALESYDVYAQLTFDPRRDIVNGTAPAGSVWHDGFNALGNDTSTSFFVANGWGPKYLNKNLTGFYQIVQPLVTPAAAGNYSFTESTISINKRSDDSASVPTFNLPVGNAFEVLEGLLTVEVDGYDSVDLTSGDVVYIPKNVDFSYYSKAAFTKVLYVAGGSQGIDQKLIKSGQYVSSVAFPIY